MASSSEIYQQLRKLLEERPGISFAYLHGSIIEGPTFHDLDAAVYLNSPQSDPFDYEITLNWYATGREKSAKAWK
jgi:predicted nucleotidyltransferase